MTLHGTLPDLKFWLSCSSKVAMLAGRVGVMRAVVRRSSVLLSQTRALSAVADGPQFRLELLGGENKGVALFTLARPAARNALGKQMMAEFNQAMDAVRFDPNVRVVVVQSTVPKGMVSPFGRECSINVGLVSVLCWRRPEGARTNDAARGT